MKAPIPFLLLTVYACSSGNGMMNMSSYSDVTLGATSEQLISSYGKPNHIKNLPDGTVEYEYVERIKVGERNLEERRYIIVLKDGQVVSKRMKQGSPPPFIFDSYQMQTTQNGPAAESPKDK
jgi:hypothetical protein